MTSPLRIVSELPPGLLELEADELCAALRGPTLVRLPGRQSPAMFVSLLLHGNETSGWDGARRYLRDTSELPRAIDLFIANVEAAAEVQRVLPGQSDFNRIWRSTDGVDGALPNALAQAVGHTNYFAAVDLHNNTGHNPYYSVVTDKTPANFGLALLFSGKAVLVEEPDTTLTNWFSGRCPAVALETGPVGDPRCADRVYDFLERCLILDRIEPASSVDLELFRARARVHVRSGIDMAFAGEGTGASLLLTGGVEAVNFHELPAGIPFASTGRSLVEVLQVLDPQHRDVTDLFFVQDDRNVLLREAVVPAMYTTDPFVIEQDCLCYFMERLED